MNRVRAASICQTCSGRGPLFFKGGKGLMTKDNCDKAIDNCLTSLFLTAKIIKLANWIIHNVDSIRQMDIDLQTNFLTTKVKLQAALKEISESHLLQSIKDMTHSDIKASPMSAMICDKFFNLAAETVVQKILEDIICNPINRFATYWSANTLINNSAAAIKAQMPQLEKELAKGLEEWNKQQATKRRLLESLSSESDSKIFTSDVTLFLPSTDSPEAFICAAGQEKDFANQRILPLNLSMIYP